MDITITGILELVGSFDDSSGKDTARRIDLRSWLHDKHNLTFIKTFGHSLFLAINP